MSESERTDVPEPGDREWRETLVEVERARIDYAKDSGTDDEDDRAVGRKWLRLWRAERHRDELIKKSR
jgi:hypothetical protein